MSGEEVVQDVFAVFRAHCRSLLSMAFQTLAFTEPLQPRLELPPSRNFGELSTSVGFEIAKTQKRKPAELAAEIVKQISPVQSALVKNVEAVNGYINFRMNYEAASNLLLKSVLSLADKYGFVPAEHPRTIIVEHTSANPIHALHIGQARNPIIGDALARMLRKRAHRVLVHFYIDDTGRQSAIIAYGYAKLGNPAPPLKPDTFIGQIYSVASCLIEIAAIKNRLRASPPDEEAAKLRTQLDEWVGVSAELESKYPDVFNRLLKSLADEADPDASVASLIKRYESGEEQAKTQIRRVSGLCVEGFTETLRRLDIAYDSWDWESDLLWSGEVKEIVEKLGRTRYVRDVNGALEFDAGLVAEELKLRPALGLADTYEVPALTLVRSDGTALYTTKDIAYSIRKLGKAEQVVNVIGREQSLAQIHLKIALAALGRQDALERMRHFSYGLVELPGYKMSSRRGRIVTLDSVIDEAIKRASEEVSKRSQAVPAKEREKIAEKIGISAIKYALLAVEPQKNILFLWDRVLNFEANSAPFINYAYTRTVGILGKVGEFDIPKSLAVLNHTLEQDLMLSLARFPEIFCAAADNLRPEDITNYALNLAERFHEYYEKVDVAHVKEKDLKFARATLVKAVQIVLRNACSAIGIEFSEKM